MAKTRTTKEKELTPAAKASRAQAKAKTALVHLYWDEYQKLYRKEAKKLGVNIREEE
jgi:hypothetical protein